MGYMRDYRGNRLDSFDPFRDLGTLAGWWDASTDTRTNGASLYEVWDKARNAPPLRGAGGSVPTLVTNFQNGLPVFNLGSNGYFNCPDFGQAGLLQPTTTGIAQPFVIAMLVRANSSAGISGSRNLLGGTGGSTTQVYMQPNQGSVAVNAGSLGINGGPNISDDTFHSVIAVCTPGTGLLMVDGQVVQCTTTQAHGSNPIPNLQIGGQQSSGNFQGYVAEVIIAQGLIPSMDKLAACASYFNTKWGLGQTIPTEHIPGYIDTTDSASVNCRIWLPENLSACQGGVLVSHQAGGNEQIGPGYQQYPMIHAMVNAGYMVGATRQHSDSWGNNSALTDLANLWTLMKTYQSGLTSCVLFGMSMGGVPSANAVQKSSLPAGVVKGVLSLDGVMALSTLYSNGSYTGGINSAYGITQSTLAAGVAVNATSVSSNQSYPNGTQIMLGNGTANVETVTVNGAPTGAGPFTLPITAATKSHNSGDQISDYPTKTAGFDPILQTISLYTGVRWRFYLSDSDATVPDSTNGIAMSTALGAAGSPPAEYAYVKHNGGHLASTQPLPSDATAFIKRCLGF